MEWSASYFVEHCIYNFIISLAVAPVGSLQGPGDLESKLMDGCPWHDECRACTPTTQPLPTLNI